MMDVYLESLDALYERLDRLEGCEDNPVYAAEIRSIRAEIDSVIADIMECLYG